MSSFAEVVGRVETAPSLKQPNLWWRFLAIAVPVAWLYYSIVLHLLLEWWKDPNFSHGFLVPMLSLFLVLRDRNRLLALPLKPSFWGLVIIAFAMGILVLGVLGAELFLSRVSLLILIFGLIVLFAGWNYFRALLFPWALLFLMVPIPAIILNQLTVPLQIFASKIAAGTLPFLGVPVLREGNIINLPAMPLEVAEACSGIRSMISLIVLAVIYGQLMEKSRSIRLLLMLAAVPVAISANSLRIIGTGLLVQYWGPGEAQGFFHYFSGWIIFLVSLLMIYALHRFLPRARGMWGIQRAH